MENQNRQVADEDFMRSLSQLENLLESESAVKSTITIEAVEPVPKFGGSILDAIPLAQRLGNRLENGLGMPKKAKDFKTE